MGSNTTVSVATVAAAIGTLIVWGLTALHAGLPAGGEAAIVTLVTAGLTYLLPSLRKSTSTESEAGA